MLTDLARAFFLFLLPACFFTKKCAASKNIEKHRAVGFPHPRPGRPGVATRREQVRLSARFTKGNDLAHARSLVHTFSDESASTPRSILTLEASILPPQSVIVDPPRVIRNTPLDPSRSFWGACGLLAD